MASASAVLDGFARLATITCIAASLWGLADGCVALVRHGGASALGVLVAPLHVAALYAPLGVPAALVLAALSAWVRRVPVWARLRAFVVAPRRLFDPEPERTASLLAHVLLVGALVLATRFAFVDFQARFARADLAGWLLGGILAAALVLSPGIVAIARGVIVRLVPRTSRLAAPGTWVVLAMVAGGVALALTRRSPIWFAYRPLDVAWGPIGVLLLAVVAFALAPRLRSRRLRYATLGGVVVGLVATGLTYGAVSSERIPIETSSVLGGRLLAFYARFVDRDGDGHTAAFGGEDCDDGNSHIHPGAADPRGDGIDADCFAGDGAPDVAPRGDGAMVPLEDAASPRNILLVTIDTLHRGHLGVNGYDRPTSPNIDAFASTAAQFEQVLPQSSRSVLSIPSMLIGLYPSEVARGDESFWPAILPENVAFAEVLAAHGYRTEAYIGTNYFARLRGFYQGFAAVRESPRLRSPRAEPVDQTIEALARLRDAGQPFLVWTHLMNVHEPYLDDGIPPRFGSDVRAQYDTEIALADEQFGRLMTRLTELGLDGTTTVILASDHGEAFGDHNGVFFHASSLYEDQLASMLFVRVPGLTQGGTRIEDPVALLDVMPTVLNVAGLAAPEPVSGRSLLGCLDGCDRTRPVFAELIPEGPFPNNVRKVRRGDASVVWNIRTGTFEGFDLADDPHELADVIERPALQELRDVLRAWVAHSSRTDNRGDDAFVEQFRVEAVDPRARAVGLRYEDRLAIEACETPTGLLHRGDTFRVTCFLRALGEMDEDLKVVVWFTGPTDPPRDFHGIHVPIHGRYHTDQWREGELLRDVVAVVVPPDITVPSRWEINVAIDTIDGQRQVGERRGQRAASARIGVLSIAP